MAMISTNEFKAGLKLLMEGVPYNIIENEFVKPGKGQAFNRVKLRHLLTQRVVEKTFKSGDSVELADIAETQMQYLYQDADGYHFMDNQTFEQYLIGNEVMEKSSLWLMGQETCTVMLWNNQPIQVLPPNFVILKIIETDPGVRGDTSGGGGKPAKLETGAVVRVPLFVQQDEYIKVDTREGGTYVARASASDRNAQ